MSTKTMEYPHDTFEEAVHEVCLEILESPEIRERFRKKHDELESKMIKDTLFEIAGRDDYLDRVRERLKEKGVVTRRRVL